MQLLVAYVYILTVVHRASSVSYKIRWSPACSTVCLFQSVINLCRYIFNLRSVVVYIISTITVAYYNNRQRVQYSECNFPCSFVSNPLVPLFLTNACGCTQEHTTHIHKQSMRSCVRHNSSRHFLYEQTMNFSVHSIIRLSPKAAI